MEGDCRSRNQCRWTRMFFWWLRWRLVVAQDETLHRNANKRTHQSTIEGLEAGYLSRPSPNSRIVSED
jgi:hypothetical protein